MEGFGNCIGSEVWRFITGLGTGDERREPAGTSTADSAARSTCGELGKPLGPRDCLDVGVGLGNTSLEILWDVSSAAPSSPAETTISLTFPTEALSLLYNPLSPP